MLFGALSRFDSALGSYLTHEYRCFVALTGLMVGILIMKNTVVSYVVCDFVQHIYFTNSVGGVSVFRMCKDVAHDLGFGDANILYTRPEYEYLFLSDRYIPSHVVKAFAIKFGAKQIIQDVEMEENLPF